MITVICATCEAKLIVKDEKLLGKILACPKCGSMVLVQPPDDVPAPPAPLSKKARKKFPDVLTHGTSSGIIGEVPPESRRSNFLMEAAPPQADVSETEIKTRKILLGVLIGLVLFLLMALGFLMIFRGSAKPVPEIPPPIEQHAEQPVEPVGEPVEPPMPDIVPPPEEEPPEILPIQDPHREPEPANGEPVSTPNGLPADSASAPSDSIGTMPDFVDVPLPRIDIDARLALPIHELHFDRQRLIGFVRDMSQITGVPMTLDIDEMKPRSLSVNTAVSGQFNETTAGEILTETLAVLDLQWTAADNQILIFPKEAVQEETVKGETEGGVDLTFDVSDFAEGTDDLTPEVLAGMIQALIIPEDSVEVLPDHRLTVVQHNDTDGRSPVRKRDEIFRFLEQLRLIRQLPQQTELTGEHVAPEAFGWDRVMEPMTLNHYQAVPLSHIVRQLESLTGLTILVDHQSLHRAFYTFASVQATVQCNHGTVNDALELSLASAGSASLAYRIIDDQTLEITTAEAAQQPEKMVMEVHPYPLLDGTTPEEIVRLLRLAIAPESWCPETGTTAERPEMRLGGNIVIDVPSNCLLIRQSQPVQRQIRLYLSESTPLEP